MDSNPQPPVQTNRKKLTQRTKIALMLVLGPTILIATSFIIFVITNVAFGYIPQTLPAACEGSSLSLAEGGSTIQEECRESLLAAIPPVGMAFNFALIGLMLIGIAAWLPGLIAGLVLLVKKPTNPSDPPDFAQ